MVIMIEDNNFKLIALDPGSDTLGFAAFDVDSETFEIKRSIAFTITASKLVNDESWIATRFSYRTARIYKLKELLLNYYAALNPSFVACESPFFNPRRPGAFEPLVEVKAAIRDSVIEHNPWVNLTFIDPSSIKKSVGAPGNADKAVMKKAVSLLTDLNYDGEIKIIDLDEHSIDALAVGYCKIKNMKNTLQ
jgi:Holliday junction resolvasome RuvABC endonuclease subunit